MVLDGFQRSIHGTIAIRLGAHFRTIVLNDNAGITAAQVIAFGKTYALQKTNPNAGNYAPYNHVHKKTDMDYARLQGDLGNGLSIDNTLYTYDYRNKTLSTTSAQQTTADIANGVTRSNGSIVNGVFFPNDVPGYAEEQHLDGRVYVDADGNRYQLGHGLSW